MPDLFTPYDNLWVHPCCHKWHYLKIEGDFFRNLFSFSHERMKTVFLRARHPVSKTCLNIENTPDGWGWDRTFMGSRPAAALSGVRDSALTVGSWGWLERARYMELDFVPPSHLWHPPTSWPWGKSFSIPELQFPYLHMWVRHSYPRVYWENEKVHNEWCS